MQEAFPEATIDVPVGMIADGMERMPEHDRHVLCAAVCSNADAIVTFNQRHFPAECLSQFAVLCHDPDTFLLHQLHLNASLVLQTLDAQASAIRRERGDVLKTLENMASRFATAALERS